MPAVSQRVPGDGDHAKGDEMNQGWKLACTIALLLFAGACNAPEPVETEQGEDSAATDGAIPVGVLLPFTGEYSWVGENVQAVANMIVDEVNESGGIGGADIELVQGDTEGTVDAGVSAAQKLVNVDRVVAFVGPTSLEFTGVRRVIDDTGTSMMSPTAGTTELDDAGDELFFRTVPSDSLGGKAIAKAIADATFLGVDDAFSRPALMVGKDPALISFKEPITTALAENGVDAVTSLTYETGKQSYRSEVQQALESDPDVVILIGSPEDSARLMQNAFEAGYEGSWFVTQDQTNAEFVELAGAELVEGIYGLVEAPFEEAGDILARFKERLAEETGSEEPEIFALNTYDAMNVLTLAMLKADLDGEEVTRDSITAYVDEVANPDSGDTVVTSYTEGKEALENDEGIDYQGLVGPVDFDRFGNITAPFSIQQVSDGKWTGVAVIPAEELQ